MPGDKRQLILRSKINESGPEGVLLTFSRNGDVWPQFFVEKPLTRTKPHFAEQNGALAQLGERLICIQEVRSSILLGSTIRLVLFWSDD